MKRLIVPLLCILLAGCALAQQQQLAEARKKYRAANRQANEGIVECSEMFREKELTSHVAAAECANERISAAYEAVDYPRMDLINVLNAKRLEIAERVDRHRITTSQAKLEFANFTKELGREERERQMEAQEVAAEQHRQDVQQIWLPMMTQGLSMMQQR